MGILRFAQYDGGWYIIDFMTKLLVLALVLTMQACHAVMETAVPEPPPALPTILAPVAAPAEPIKLEDGLEIGNQLDKIRVKNQSGADQSVNQALNHAKTNILVFVKPGCIYCESLEAVLDGKRYKGKSNLVFIIDAVHANQAEFKKKTQDHKKTGAKWLYDYTNKFTEIYGVNSFPQFIVLGKDGKILKYQRGLVMPENKESLAKMDTALILQTLSRSTVAWLEQY